MIEEFGMPRDGGSFEPRTSTTFKDRFYQLIYSAVLDSVRSGGPLQGCNFWGWGGEGRAQHPDHHFVRGDTSYLADPPHEPQGWYSVFDMRPVDAGGDPRLCERRQGLGAIRNMATPCGSTVPEIAPGPAAAVLVRPQIAHRRMCSS